jgi:hypothetical protein
VSFEWGFGPVYVVGGTGNWDSDGPVVQSY